MLCRKKTIDRTRHDELYKLFVLISCKCKNGFCGIDSVILCLLSEPLVAG